MKEFLSRNQAPVDETWAEDNAEIGENIVDKYLNQTLPARTGEEELKECERLMDLLERRA